MKTCPVCGREDIPDNVTTSHHPNGCPCRSYTLHASDGNNQGPLGCVWCTIISKIGKSEREIADEYFHFCLKLDKANQALKASVQSPVVQQEPLKGSQGGKE
jgi:hypothetical protein